jgi:1-acyl-sn-glycerol-3-phosphate acyltransferase
VRSTQNRLRLLVYLQFSLAYLSYGLSKAVFMLLVFPLVLTLTPFPRTKLRFVQAVVHGFLTVFARGYLPALGIYKIREVTGLEHVPAGEPVVFVANHRGVMDSLLLLSLLPGTGIVLKTRYARWPVNSSLVRHFDFVDLGTGSPRTLARGLEKCQAMLRDGRSLLIFPEGTRSPTGRLRPFKDAAFRLAHAAGVAVVPVVIHHTYPFMAKVPGSMFPRRRVEYRIRFLPPLGPGEGGPAEVSDRVRRLLTRELARLDAGTFWETYKGSIDAQRTSV